MKYHYTCHHCGHSWDSDFVLLACEKCYSRSVSRFYVVPAADVLKAAPGKMRPEETREGIYTCHHCGHSWDY